MLLSLLLYAHLYALLSACTPTDPDARPKTSAHAPACDRKQEGHESQMSNVSFSRKESFRDPSPDPRHYRVINIILGDPFGPKPLPYQF